MPPALSRAGGTFGGSLAQDDAGDSRGAGSSPDSASGMRVIDVALSFRRRRRRPHARTDAVTAVR
ncbi:hypothetical protein GCM10010521_30660 [Streptomyces rameus]|uniref:Uncharacterized protein n=1 Tax=Streptomyces rameus TaxID=68261 RepID=A0ABP6NAQ5_9ACTN